MSIYIVEQQDLKNWGVNHLYEVFQRVPGYTFYNTDYYGQYGVIGRGAQSIWRYGLSIELMPWVDFGHWEFTPNFIKNMEIARGPGGGVTWGSSAEAGLVNINIRDDLEGLEVVAQSGNYSRSALDIMYGGKFNDTSDDGYFIGYHVESQDPIVQNDVRSNYNPDTDLSNEYKLNGIKESYTVLSKIKRKNFKFISVINQAAHVAPALWFSSNQAAENTIDSHLGDNWGDGVNSYIYRMEYDVPLSNIGKFTLYRNYYRKQWRVPNLATDGFQQESWGLLSELEFFDNKVSINAGTEINGTVRRLFPSITSAWGSEIGVDWFENSKGPATDKFSNIFMQVKYRINESISASIAGRYDNVKYDNGESVSLKTGPRIGLYYNLSNVTTLKYLYSDNKRAPAINEILSSAPSPERLYAHELILSHYGNSSIYNLTLFSQKLEDQITRVNDGSFNEFLNTGGLSIGGIEWDYKHLIARNYNILANGSYHVNDVQKKKFDNDGDGKYVEISEPHNDDNQALFVPETTIFLGQEYRPFDDISWFTGLRSIIDIPYRSENGEYKKASGHFIDTTITCENIFADYSISASILNLLDSRPEMPAYGEHIGNRDGTIEPEAMKYYVSLSGKF